MVLAPDTPQSTSWTSAAPCPVSALPCVSPSSCPLCREPPRPSGSRGVSRTRYCTLHHLRENLMIDGFVSSSALLAKQFLSQDWVTASGEKERGSKFNETLHALLRCVLFLCFRSKSGLSLSLYYWSKWLRFFHVFSIYLENVDDVLKAVEEIAGERISELVNATNDDHSVSWPTLNR